MFKGKGLKLVLGLTVFALLTGIYFGSSNDAFKSGKAEAKQEVLSVSEKAKGPIETTILGAMDSLQSNSEVKVESNSKIITIEASNMVMFKGPVTDESVSAAQRKMESLRFKLKESDVIYLVMDTPGGDVFAGLNFIDYLKSIPNKVQTITLFAASMGFQIVQNSDTRFITNTGILMSHRASGGVEGQFDGEIETRYKFYKRNMDYMDAIASKRMGLTLEAYKTLIKDEYWVTGFDSVKEKAADETVSLRCGSSLNGTEVVKYDTMFGPVNVEFSQCPLIKAPLSISLANIAKESKNQAAELMDKAFSRQEDFVRDVVMKNETQKYFK